MSNQIDWRATAAVHRTEGEVRTDIAQGPLSDMVQRFLAEPDAERHRLVLTRDGEEMGLDEVQALRRRSDFPGAY